MPRQRPALLHHRRRRHPPSARGVRDGPRHTPTEWQAYQLTKEEYWVLPLSSTFHGRDIFSPTAAHLANRSALHDLGIGVIDLSAFALPQPREVPGTAIGQIIHIDRFGNLITNLRQVHLPAGPLRVRVAGR